MLRRPLCRFKSCPSEPANSSCSIFIKPLSLKEPYPDHGKSHSSRSRSHALSILALIPLLPARLSLSLSLSPPFTSLVYLSLPPSLSLSLWHTHTYTFTYIHSDTFSPTHIYINTHIRNTHAHAHAPTQSIRVQHTCAGWGERCCRGFSGSVVSEFAVLSFGEEAGLNCFLFPLPLIPGMLKLDWWTFQNFVFQTLSAIITSRCTLPLYFLLPLFLLTRLLWCSFISSLSFFSCILFLSPPFFNSVCSSFVSYFPPSLGTELFSCFSSDVLSLSRHLTVLNMHFLLFVVLRALKLCRTWQCRATGQGRCICECVCRFIVRAHHNVCQAL